MVFVGVDFVAIDLVLLLFVQPVVVYMIEGMIAFDLTIRNSVFTSLSYGASDEDIRL